MRSLALIAALGASTLALPVFAQTTQPAGASSPSTSQATAPAKAPDDASSKPICKSVTEGGTHIPKHECHTKAEWDQIRADARQNLTDTSHPEGPH